MTAQDFITYYRENIPANQRAGQFAFNYLYEIRRDLAERIRATEFDPFYAKDTARFEEWILENW